MYRPWGFPEFAPQQQYVFDKILETVTEVFSQYNFQHIRTPAVEPVEILKKGGDIIDQQVYGLYGLAQWPEDTKEYALHFDLTVPLARYILDHRQNITFPFKRYQMQPVRRGERTKRGRYKEFRQFDVDVVRPSESKVGVWYDVETVAVLSKAMQTVCERFNVSIESVLKISHIGLTKSLLQSFDLSDEEAKQILALLDGYYKADHETFSKKLKPLVPKELYASIQKLIETKDVSLMSAYEGYDDLSAILDGLESLGVPYEYDICIVRGHNYYKGMVCEWFEKQDVSFGSLAGGGRYDNITDFIDPKQSFSGVGTSLGRFVYLAVEKLSELSKPDSYLFVNFEDTLPEVLKLYNAFLAAGKTCEIYPTAAKLGKQFEYADKKWISHVVVCGETEKDEWVFKLKNLKTGDERSYTIIECFGAMIFSNRKVLLVQNHGGGRGFPKWQPEGSESRDESMLREVEEETGITKLKSLDDAVRQTSYFYDNGEAIFKTIFYKAFSVTNEKVTLQKEELADYRRAAREEALELLPLSMHHLLDTASRYFV